MVAPAINTPQQVLASLGQFNVMGDHPRSQTTDSDSIPWCYWRKKDGWLTVGQYNPTEFMRQVKKGMAPLESYQFFYLNDKNQLFKTYDKWRHLLQMGGAREFPADQVVEMGWHRTPPVAQDQFGRPVSIDVSTVYDPATGTYVPLADYTIHDAHCTFCNKVIGSSLKQEAAETILRKHEKHAHETNRDQRQLSATLSEAQAEPTKAMAAVVEQLAIGQQQLAAQMAQQQAVTNALLERLTRRDEDDEPRKGRRGRTPHTDEEPPAA